MRLIGMDHFKCVYRQLQEALHSIEYYRRIQQVPWNSEDAVISLRMVRFPTTPGLQKRTFPSFPDTFSYVDSRLDFDEFPRLNRAITSREYEAISLLWWIMIFLKSWRTYIDVGFVMFRILVRSDQTRKMLDDTGVGE
jgi:hypothetical protein